jgi:NAD(P)H dehydrogenase (quinone)
MSTFAMHHGMVVVPLGYGVSDRVGKTESGGSPYGPSHAGDGDLTDDEREIALAYGAHLHTIADKLAA